jgi:hypothetical protein
LATYIVREKCERSTGNYRENGAGENCDPLHYLGKKQKFVTVVCNLETAEPVWLCAGHVQQFGGASPPANLMEVKAK